MTDARSSMRSAGAGESNPGRCSCRGLGPHRVAGEPVPVHAELASDEIQDGRRNELARSQQAAPGRRRPTLTRGAVPPPPRPLAF